MKLLILCAEPGLRAALGAQFRDHKQSVVWLESTESLTPELFVADESAFVIDCLGGAGEPGATWPMDDLLARLSANCNARDWSWLLLSDSRVFPASGKRRFTETDTAAPSARIGELMRAREHAVIKNIARHIVLRTGPVIASYGDNLLTQFLRQFRGGGVIAVPNEQRFCPTPAADIARVIAAIHDQLECGAACWGAFHYESADPVNSYEFAEVVLAAATQYWQIAENTVHLRDMVADGAVEAFPLLNCQHIRDTFGIQQLPWRKVIPAMLKQIYALNSSEIRPS